MSQLYTTAVLCEESWLFVSLLLFQVSCTCTLQTECYIIYISLTSNQITGGILHGLDILTLYGKELWEPRKAA